MNDPVCPRCSAKSDKPGVWWCNDSDCQAPGQRVTDAMIDQQMMERATGKTITERNP